MRQGKERLLPVVQDMIPQQNAFSHTNSICSFVFAHYTNLLAENICEGMGYCLIRQLETWWTISILILCER